MKRLLIDRIILILVLVTIAVACNAVKNRSPKAMGTTVAPTATLSPTAEPTAEPTATPTALEALLDETADLANFPPKAPIIVHFNQPMEVNSTDAPLSVIPARRGSFEWQDNNNTLVFTPENGLLARTEYEVRLSSDLKSENGQTLAEALSWQLHTTFTPQVIGRTPTGDVVSDWQPIINVRFNKPMAQESIPDALRITPDLPFELAWIDSSNLEIILLDSLQFDTTYEFMIDQNATDKAGIPILNEYIWSYRLKDVIARQYAPTGNDPDSPLTVSFNYQIDPAQRLDGLELEPAIEGEWVWNEEHTALYFLTDEYFKAETEYTLTFDAPFTTADGVSLPALEPLEFTTTPAIISHRPNTSGVYPDVNIEIRFDRPMDATATEAAFSIEPAVNGSFEWQETTLIFRPDENLLAEHTEYEVSIDTTAAGANGEAILDSPYSWHFTTTALPDIVSFGYGPNAQVLDADGRRAIQYVLTRSLAQTLTFELYSLSLEQFLDRYASGFRGSAGWEFNPISTEGTQLAYSWQVRPEDLPNDYNNIREVIIPGEVSPGLYLLNAKAGRLDDQLILMLTANTLTVKQAEGQVMAWVTDINGSPVSGIEVGVYARDGRLLISDTADSRGVFRGQIPDFEVGGPAAIEPLVVVAQNGGDITASGLTPEWRSYTGASWYWWQPSSPGDEYSAHVFTERPIYRPGQTVFFKAILRADEDAVLDVPPAGTPATVRIRDARNNVVQTLEMTTNDFGSLDGTFQLAEGAMLGEYKIELTLDNDVHSQIFKVEDYRKPDYQVTISTDAEQYMDGDTVTIVVDTEYYFGEPVPNAQVSIIRYVADSYYYGDYYYSGSVSWSHPYNPQAITGRTDAEGKFTTTVEVEVSDSYYQNSWGSNLHWTMYGYEATVDDGSHQSVSSFTAVEVFDKAEYITVNTGSYVQTPGNAFNIVANVNNIYDEPVNGRQLTVQLRRWNQTSREYDHIIQSDSFTTGENGRGTLPFTIEEAGYYQLRVFGLDRNGHSISYHSWIYAYSNFYSSWYGRDGSNLTVTADKENYAPGETANLLIESDFSGPALLSFERGTTRREMLVELTAPVTMIEVPIVSTDVPNIHVIVNAWEAEDTTLRPDMYESIPDSNLRTAYINLSVPATHKILNVTITPDKDVYAPREEATFTVEVTNYRGEPVSAEVSLAMVDEAIFALSEELSGPIYDAFYYERSNVVRTFNSLALTRYLYSGGKGGGGGDGFVAGNPRSDFQDTAAWFPTLYTDANGQVQVTITLPDNLTSWRLTAKAATADTQIGETIFNILTKQPIVIRPLLPRTLTAGDTVGLSAVVHNYSGATQTIQVSVRESSGSLLTFEESLTQTITLPPDGLQIVGWTVNAEEAGEVALIFAAAPLSATVGGDAVQLPLTVRPLAIPDVETQVGQFNNQLSTSINMPAGALPMSEVEIQLSRTIAGSLIEGLEYLTGFPYGCVEQTMSRALPNAVVGRALNQLGISNPTLQADLPAKINASVQRLYGFQHNDGGWGWWFDDNTHDYQTAWVIFGLATTAEAGYEIDPNVITRGVAWMNENLSSMDIRTRAFALYSMAVAGQPNAEATLALYQRVDELDTFSQAALALALYRLNERVEAREIIDLLAETAVNENGFVHWDGSNQDGAYHSKTMASEVRSTALALSAFTTIRPGHQLEGGMVRWLMNQRKQQGWGTTNETSFAIIGLTDHLLATSFSDTAAETEYTVTLNGEVIATGNLGRGEPAVSLTIPQEQLQGGQNNLVIQKSGSGQLYYVVNTTVYLEQAVVEAAGEIRITRQYIDPETNLPVTSFEAGQLVVVKLRVWLPQDGSYMIVEDSLPGGLEALNERLNTTTHAADPNYFQETVYYWQDYGYNHKEIFGDRVSFFITEWDEGWHTITYIARATRPGTFTAMPAESYAMYNLALWGRSASHMITVSEFEG